MNEKIARSLESIATYEPLDCLAAFCSDALLGQLPTGAHKARVWLHRSSLRVLKGPYQWPRKASMVANMLFRYTLFADHWNDRVCGAYACLRLHTLPIVHY